VYVWMYNCVDVDVFMNVFTSMFDCIDVFVCMFGCVDVFMCMFGCI